LFKKVCLLKKQKKNLLFFFVLINKGDEVLELGGVSLRGKSALFVENLMNTIQNEFEIIVRNINSHSFLTTDINIQRRHSMDTSELSPTETINNPVIKSKSTTVYSLHKTSITIDKNKSLPTVIKIILKENFLFSLFLEK